MDFSDNLSNGEKQVKLHHMFQKANDEQNNSNGDSYDLDSQYAKNMSRIAKSFKSDHNASFEIETKSLVNSTSRLIDNNTIDSTRIIYDYFDDIRNFYKPKEIVEEVLSEELEEIVEEIEEEKLNIDEIIKSSEKVIFNSNDKKTLLKDLINDISVNSSSNFTYDDEKFEQNIKDMLGEVTEEHDEDAILIEAVSPIVDNVQGIKKTKTSLFLIFSIIILLLIAIYVNRDYVIKFITQT